MNRFLLAVLLWVMVLAVPMQGMAASLMLSCSAMHTGTTQGHRGVQADAADAAVDDSGAAVECDHALATHGHSLSSSSGVVDGDEGDHADATGNDPLSAHHADSKCSACVACCSVLALPTTFSPLESSRLVHALVTSMTPARASHAPERLDRPPRSADA